MTSRRLGYPTKASVAGAADARSVHFPTLLSLSGTTPWDACPAKRWERTRCTQAKPVLTSWWDMKRKSNRPVRQGLFATSAQEKRWRFRADNQMPESLNKRSAVESTSWVIFSAVELF